MYFRNPGDDITFRNSDKVQSKIKVFKQMRSFDDLGDADLKELAIHATCRHFRKRETIFQEGDTPDFFYVVQHGRIKLFKESLSGRDFIVTIAYRGVPLNVPALFEGEAYYLSAQAIDEATVLCVRREIFLSFVKKHPSVAIKIISILSKLLSSAYNRIADLAEETVHQRICNTLLMLSAKFGNTLSIKREDIAEMAGTTAETCIRVLSKLRSLGILASRRGQLTIIDVNKLRNLSKRSYIDYVPKL